MMLNLNLKMQEFQALLPLKGKRPEIWKPGSLQLSAQNFEKLGQSMHVWPECSKSAMPDPMAKYPVLTDVQGLQLTIVMQCHFV